MPRRSRASTHVPGALAHIICRFVDYRFLLEDEGRSVYLDLLRIQLAKSDWRLVSYALMSSHIHLGAVMGSEPLELWVRPLNQRFAIWMNKTLRSKRDRPLGPVFADRPTSKVVCPTRTRFLLAYHHRNPLQAGVVDDVGASEWTSHGAYAGLRAPMDALHVELGLRLSGFATTRRGRRAFHAFVARTEVATDDVFGGDERAPQIARASACEAPALVAESLVRMAAQVCGQPLASIRGGSRQRGAVRARRVALVAWMERGGATATIAARLGISQPAASQLLSRPHDAVTVRRLAGEVRRRLSGES